MRMMYAALIGGALLAGAGAVSAQAQGVAGGYAYSPYSTGYGVGYGDAINPGASYGLNSTEAGIAGAPFAGANTNASSQAMPLAGTLATGRAATYGAPPMVEDEDEDGAY